MTISDGQRFFNPWKPQWHHFWHVLYWQLTAKPKPWVSAESSLLDIPPERVTGDQLRISFVGHSTVLIQTQGVNILSDPVWSVRVSPFKHFGPKRYSDPGISFDDLPKIDYALISHAHYDHLDLPTIKKIWERDRPKIVAPLGNDCIIQTAFPDIRVETLDWHELNTSCQRNNLSPVTMPALVFEGIFRSK